jgi:signal transduction histidine kinase/CheY-like chemotaxis protein
MGRSKSTRKIAAGSRNRLIVGTEAGLVVGRPAAYSSSGWDFRLYPNPGVSPVVYGVASDTSGAIWYGCGKSICICRNDQVVSPADWGVPPDEYTSIIEDRQGNIWARSLTRLVELPKGSRRFVVHGQNLAPAVRLGRLDVDSAGDLLVPTARGLACRTPAGAWYTIDKSNGLPSSGTRITLEDREGSLWIGVTGSGLVRWIGRRRWESWTEAEGLSHDIIWGIERDRAGTLWAATESGLSRFDERTRHWKVWPDSPLRTGRILALKAARDGKLWAGLNPGGVVELDPRTHRTVMYGAAAGLTNTEVVALEEDLDGHVWVATLEGLFEGSRTEAGMRFQRIRLLPDDSLEFIAAVSRDSLGRIWVATWYGVFVRESGGWRRFTTRDGLRRNAVGYMGEAPDGGIWIGYREPSGVSRLHSRPERLEITHYSHADGMSSDQALFVGSDVQGKMWVGTGRGLDSYDGRKWVHHDTSDGLIWNDCDANAFYADQDGSIWVGTSRGISHFHAAGAPPRPSAAPAVLTSASLGGTQVPLTGEVTVPYSQRAFHATFAALSFVNEESARIRYRLSGLDTAWVETQDDDARYSGLRPGAYTFEAEAKVEQGGWSEPARFSFHIAPPWWLRWWALGADAVACCLLGWQLWAWRMRNIMNRQKALEHAVEERTRELTREQKRVLEEKQRAEQRREIVERQNVEIERLFRESQESARLKSEFLANISHEIRTPMNGIIGMTDLLFRTSLDGDQAECLRLVKISADSLLSVINDVLDFSKIEAGKLDLDWIEFGPMELFEDTIKAMEVLAQTKRLELRFSPGDNIPQRLMGDPGRLRQVLVNLVGNAIKFTDRGIIGIEVSGPDAANTTGEVDLRIAVRDCGIGIKEEKQKVIFEPFRQADGSTSRRYGGTGLGLAICARLVKLMGGRIWLESREGVGSTFFFTAKLRMPAPEQAKAGADPAASLHAAGVHAAASGRSLRVLVAEDNPVNQKLALRLLEAAGHRVVCAHDGLQAVEILARDRFDVVLMDVQMPFMDGFEATIEIRKMDAALRLHTPIVALTANAMKGDRERCLSAGMDAYVSKPLRSQELLSVMAELAERSHLPGQP